MVAATVDPAGAGSAAAFSAFYADEYGNLVGWLTRKTGSVAAAEDLAQAAFEKAWQSWDSFVPQHGPRSRHAWLYTVANNRFLDLRRHEAFRPMLPITESVIAGTVGDDLELVADRLDLAALLGRLRPEDRRILLLRTQQMPYEEWAARWGTTVASLKSAVFRARSALRAVIAQEEAAWYQGQRRIGHEGGGAE